jgi:hypothetical protein
MQYSRVCESPINVALTFVKGIGGFLICNPSISLAKQRSAKVSWQAFGYHKP